MRSRSDEKRAAWLAAMARHVLANGVQSASLRPLAAAAGTSDRMLVYHFGSRERLLGEVLQHIAARLGARMTAAFDAAKVDGPAQALDAARDVMAEAEVRAGLRIWLELLSLSPEQRAPFEAISSAIAQGFLGLIRRYVPDAEDAITVLAMIEGVLVLQEAGLQEEAEVAMGRCRAMFETAGR